MIEPFVFHPFDPLRAVVIYRHNLPHWRQEGATYFITFRLNDSIPAVVLESWRKDSETWLAAHGIRGSLAEPEWHEIFTSIPAREREQFERKQRSLRESYLDRGYGTCLLKAPACHGLVSEALLFFHGERCWTGDFVVMPNHVHALITPWKNHSLESLLKSVKQRSSREINRRSGERGSLWQKESYDHIVRDLAELRRIRAYIENNPVKGNLPAGSYAYHRASELDAFA